APKPTPMAPSDSAWGGPAQTAAALRLATVEALEERAQRRPVCVVLPPGPDQEALADAVAGAPASGRLLVLLATSDPRRRPGMRTIDLAPLSAEETAELAARAAGQAPPPEVAEALLRASGGCAAILAL